LAGTVQVLESDGGGIEAGLFGGFAVVGGEGELDGGVGEDVACDDLVV